MPIPIDRVRKALGDAYDVVDRLGRGGMAAVFYAERLPDRRPVALKVLRPEFTRTVGAARFHREIEFLSTLEHPNILPLLTSAEADGLLYYVMPFASGGSLTTLLNDRVYLPVGDVAEITWQVAAALDHAHRKNIVHRDIKPGNVLFHDGRAVICDFGIARAIVQAGGEHISSSGLIIGTPAYMSPEQAKGNSEVDGRSDIYSLACVVYEMLIGEPPFTGRSAQAVMAKHIAERPPSLRVVRREIPEPVEQAVHRALAKNPKDRIQSASDFAERLAQR